jgi:hypothetical protein
VSDSSDSRACGTLAAAAGLTLFFVISSLLLSLVALLWCGFVLSHSDVNGKHAAGSGSDAASQAVLRRVSTHFHPRVFTLALLLSVDLMLAVLFWALGAHISLQTHIFVPYSNFMLSTSWGLLLAAWFVSLPVCWMLWKLVECARVEQASAADLVDGNVGTDLNQSQGSDDGIDLSEEDQQEARSVR